jgi:AcrR family transcriptional regulator
MSRKVARRPFSPVPLDGGHLRELRHVCGLFEGAEAGYRTLLPFIADGLQRGERALHIVDPAAKASHLERLAAAGIGVPEALDSGQLEVATWEEAYLRGGQFNGPAMVNFIREVLAAGRERGFPMTRTIGYMEWAVPSVAKVDDLIAYESQIEVALRGLPDPVICSYDLERHPASLVARIRDVHHVALVRGELRRSGVGRTRPRERILRAASELFSTRGIAATGIDTLIEVAGVAKATFYRQFPSKDDLVVAWLRDERTRWFDRVLQKAKDSVTSPDDLIPAMFDAAVEWLEVEDFRGCPYLNTSAEIPDPFHPARRAVEDYLEEVEGYLRDALIAMGRPHAASLAPQLQTLMAGGLMLSAAHRTTAPLRAARDAAIGLLREDHAA